MKKVRFCVDTKGGIVFIELLFGATHCSNGLLYQRSHIEVIRFVISVQPLSFLFGLQIFKFVDVF